MKHFLLFDSGCSLCTGLAQAVERESDGLLTAKSLRDQEMQSLLSQARPDWKHEPTLLQVHDGHVSAFTGIAMRVRLLAVLGPQRAYRVASVVRGFGVSITGFELSRRAFFSYSGKALAGFALLGIPGLHSPAPAALPPQGNPPTDDLQPGVREFIASNYLGHAAEYPDPNERVDALRAFLAGDTFLRAGQIDEAVELLAAAVAKNPESRHTHAGLGAALWQRHGREQLLEDLRAAAQEFLTADEIGIQFGRVHYTYEVAMTLGALQDAAALDRYFEVALAKGNREYLANLHYARGLQLLDDPRAEKWFRKAMAVEPQGISDALAYYAEWLLDRGQDDAVVKLVNDKVDLLYAHFLKGVALERLGKANRASQAYVRFNEMSRSFPAPARYRIKDSVPQTGLFFEGDSYLTTNAVDEPEAGTEGQVTVAKEKLAKVVASEAESESIGAQRAVAWAVRTRVFRAYSVSTDCGGYGSPNGRWGAREQSAKRAVKYKAICDAPGQFSQARLATPTSRQVADNVWKGQVPDPVVQACFHGEVVPFDGQCNGTCTEQTASGAFASGPAWIYAADPNGSGGTKACLDCHPNVACDCYRGDPTKPCFNGGIYENCFWRIL